LAYGALLHLTIFVPPTVLGLLILSLRPKPASVSGELPQPGESSQ
jgi:ABC-type molybdate transport system permease subunit